MIDVATVVAASTACLVGVMSPGPNFVAVTHRAVTSHRAEALALVAGIASVSALWATAALFGLGILFALFPWLLWSVKLFGAAYLVWYGLKLFRRSGASLPDKAPLFPSHSSCHRAFRDGMITNLSNPKSMAFYASVFSAAVPVSASTETLLTMIPMVGLIAFLWYGGVVFTLSTERAVNFYRKGKPMIERVCGVFLIVFGVRQVAG